mgnify:FL=1
MVVLTLYEVYKFPTQSRFNAPTIFSSNWTRIVYTVSWRIPGTRRKAMRMRVNEGVQVCTWTWSYVQTNVDNIVLVVCWEILGIQTIFHGLYSLEISTTHLQWPPIRHAWYWILTRQGCPFLRYIWFSWSQYNYNSQRLPPWSREFLFMLQLIPNFCYNRFPISAAIRFLPIGHREFSSMQNNFPMTTLLQISTSLVLLTMRHLWVAAYWRRLWSKRREASERNDIWKWITIAIRILLINIWSSLTVSLHIALF